MVKPRVLSTTIVRSVMGVDGVQMNMKNFVAGHVEEPDVDMHPYAAVTMKSRRKVETKKMKRKGRGRIPKEGPNRQITFRSGDMHEEIERLIESAIVKYRARAALAELPSPGYSDLYRYALVLGLRQIASTEEEM